MRFVVLVKENPVLQGQNSEKQSKHFVVKIHALAALIFLVHRGTKAAQNNFVKI